jgi:hypothetical protein
VRTVPEQIMTKHKDKILPANFIAVAVAEDIELARDYVEILRNNEIPSRFLNNGELVEGGGITIVVQEDHVEDARRLIRMHNTADDFYDPAFDADLDDNSDDGEE